MSNVKLWKITGAAAVLVLLAAGGWLLFGANKPVKQTGTSIQFAPMAPVEGQFARAEGLREFSFPLDHGPHPDFQTEWWYYTGNLETVEGRRFGYELTFFRRALTPQPESADDGSDWRANQVYLAHFALSDIETQEFHYQENISRGAAGLAGSKGAPVYEVWLEDWSVREVGAGRYTLNANSEGYGLELELTDLKGPILQGDRGYSQKGSENGNASYYISQTHLESSGKLRIGEEIWDVNGLSWMDHEFSTSALSAGQVGWNWFAIQLDDGSELMLFTLQRENGSLDPFNAGTIIKTDGTTHALGSADFKIDVRETWRSPHSGAEYPDEWVITIPNEEIRLNVKSLMPDQELNTFITYWEGAVEIQGERNGVPVSGFGYVELTGYAQSMQGKF